jgi:integrase
MVKVPLESKVAVKKRAIQFVNSDELNSLYDLLENSTDKRNVHRYKNSNNAHAIILIAYTGMRVGEMTALKWKNVNLEERYIDIVESTGRIKDKNGKYVAVDKSTKTETSNRRVPLPARGLEMIKYFDSFNPDHEPDDLVCLTANKTKIGRRNINRTLDSMCRDANLPHMGIHSLRHSYGSILLERGVNIKTISNLLGHKNITTTYNIYIGVDEKTKEKAVTVLDEF